ncbi:MAG: gliding motility-associated C-terminal domain-containing protein [Chitinophagales bacterium]
MKTHLFIRIINIITLVSFLSLVWSSDLSATHNRAGEITYESAPLSGEPFRYIFTITTYTRIQGGGAAAADRDSLDINFGDGTPITQAPRVNGNNNEGETVGNNIRKNIYKIDHTYPAPFDYVVSVRDPNRIDQVINIQLGNSVDIPFFLQDTIFFRDPQFFGFNSSPILLQPPIDYANIGYTFIHNPNAFDIDGDSLYFELIPPKQGTNSDVPLYQYPDQINPNNQPSSPDNNISLNPATGEFIWDAPQVAGIYNIAFLIREFRNGVQIGNMIRDMQIFVEDVNNTPPEISPLNEICLTIGDSLVLPISATDPESPPQTITLSAFGGPLEVVNPAELVAIEAFAFDTVVVGLDSIILTTDIITEQINSTTVKNTALVLANFVWQTTCDHISSSKYTVVFKAEDNFVNNNLPFPLVDLETWQLTLVMPPPTGLTANIVEQNIELTWDLPYTCDDNEKFRGFSIWRAVGCDSLDFDECKADFNGTNYIKIADSITGDSYVDETAMPGLFYSYRIVGEFANSFTNANPPNPLNVVSSLASENICIELPRDVPIITNVDVVVTDTNAGNISVVWSKPRAEDLDTLINAAPYRYEVFRSEGLGTNNFELLQSFTANSFAAANDTIYLDNTVPLNTLANAYVYKIAFYSENELVGETQTASSVFLNIEPSDNTLFLDWTFEVPWTNYEYHVYRENNDGTFELINTTTTENYIDGELQNGKEYCYYIESIGTYNATELIDPLINRSQIVCQTPIDTVPPCPPVLSISNLCEAEYDVLPEETFVNTLQWEIENSCSNDVVQYNIYYSSPFNSDYELIATNEGVSQTIFEHLLQNSLAGCYAVSAIDSFQNESLYSNIVCVENCVELELPNVFTPNGDGDNELFVPRKSSFVSSINFKVFNRWGILIYETTDPNINWNGTDQKGKEMPEAVYHYVCEVFERTSDGFEIPNQTLNGYIHLIRGK